MLPGRERNNTLGYRHVARQRSRYPKAGCLSQRWSTNQGIWVQVWNGPRIERTDEESVKWREEKQTAFQFRKFMTHGNFAGVSSPDWLVSIKSHGNTEKRVQKGQGGMKGGGYVSNWRKVKVLNQPPDAPSPTFSLLAPSHLLSSHSYTRSSTFQFSLITKFKE